MELDIITSPRYLEDHTHITVNTAGECVATYAPWVSEPFGDGCFTIALSTTDEEGDPSPPSDEHLREFVARAAQHLEQMQIALRHIAQIEEEENDDEWEDAVNVANLIGDDLARIARGMGMRVDNY